jgi:prepilin-type N-terminal cleavage/methylation domain-containing protein
MKNLERGYTFIELLAVISIFSVIGIAIVSILFTTLRGSRKSDLLVMLKQNGDFAISQMTNNIRYAKSLDTPASCTTPVTTKTITISSATDNGQTTYVCPAVSTSGITSNSASLVDTNAVAVTACNFVCTQQSVYDPPTINITFTLTPKNVNGLPENTGALPFQTSVTMRNLNYSR